MNFYVWLFPVIFIFHDMEEIIGFIPWLRKNRIFLESKYTKFIMPYEGVTTEGFAFAVYEELILCIAICIVSYLTGFYGIWLGSMIACVLHFVVHIVESIVIRKYIPAMITSIIALPVGILIIYKSAFALNYNIIQIILFCIIGIILIAVNLKFAHWLMRRYSKHV